MTGGALRHGAKGAHFNGVYPAVWFDYTCPPLLFNEGRRALTMTAGLSLTWLRKLRH
jgi:hypothetical protein